MALLGTARGATWRGQPVAARRARFYRGLFKRTPVVGADVVPIDLPSFAQGICGDDGDGVRLSLISVVRPVVGAQRAVDVGMVVDMRNVDLTDVSRAGAITGDVNFARRQREPADRRG